MRLIQDCIEILPIAIRARGLAIYNICVSLAGFLNQYLNPVGLASIGWKCEQDLCTWLTADYIVYDVWIAFELVIVFLFFKETRYMSLEETAVVYDGQAVVEDISRKGALAVEGHAQVNEKMDGPVTQVVTAELV